MPSIAHERADGDLRTGSRAGMACRRNEQHSTNRSVLSDTQASFHAPWISSWPEQLGTKTVPGARRRNTGVVRLLPDRSATSPHRDRQGSKSRESPGNCPADDVLALLLLAGPVSGQDYRDRQPRLYLSAGGALVLPGDVRASGYDSLTGQRVGTDVAFDAGPGLVLVMGYGQKAGVRGELEFGYRTFAIDKISNLRLGDDTFRGPFGAGGDVTSFSVMGNIVSSLPLGPLNFYVGGGIGIARVEAEWRSLAGMSFPEVDDRDDVFAWQLFHRLSVPSARRPVRGARLSLLRDRRLTAPPCRRPGRVPQPRIERHPLAELRNRVSSPAIRETHLATGHDGSGPNVAAEPVSPQRPGGACLSMLAAASAAAAPSVTDVRLGPYGEGTQLVVELTGSVTFEVFALARPERLVIDLPPVDWALPERTLAFGRAGVAQVRFGRFRPRYLAHRDRPRPAAHPG